ncbi:Biogenesis of lysosome-related organelles complex 1 subunit 3 [Pseudolycoriella hygida]|uniref:Biogenesis of lysosome-related organelles complex 1 subunit 3 n=1 Tax=Pseudolycoriella hygida TaxID=35572 RepID=A0A9Q0MR17_9DIPT|nr:Biogenesis of lysosome-related organelles complex 1 subunit 3 [Pseudolycoriella hygida]
MTFTFAEIASFSNISSVKYVGTQLKPNYSPLASPIRIRTVEESLLHKKLCECNLSLWNSLNSFIQSTVSSTSKKLIATDQLLVQSQVTLQTASKTIKKINDTTVELTSKFKSIVNGNFIPPLTLS